MAAHAAVLMFGQIVSSSSSSTLTKDEYYNFVETTPDQAKIFIPGFDNATTAAKRKVAANRFNVCADLDEGEVLSVEEFKVRYVTSVLSMIWDGYVEEDPEEATPANTKGWLLRPAMVPLKPFDPHESNRTVLDSTIVRQKTGLAVHHVHLEDVALCNLCAMFTPVHLTR